MSNKKIFALTLITLLTVIFLVGAVSAFEFDNVKSYNPDTETVTIKNSFLGMIELDEVAKVKLTTARETIEYNGVEHKVNKVIRGSDRLVLEFEVENFVEDYQNAFKNFEIYNVKNGLQATKEVSYKRAEYYEVEVPVYEKVCEIISNLKNGTQEDCQKVQKGTELKTQKRWVPIDKSNPLPKGNITIGIFTDVAPGDYFDGVPTFFGVRMPEYAEWTESLNEDLISYYAFEDASGDLTDAIGYYNGTPVGTPGYHATGLIDFGVDFNGADTDFDLGAYNALVGRENLTFSGWVKWDSTDNSRRAIISMEDTGDGHAPLFLTKGNGASDNDVDAGVSSSSTDGIVTYTGDLSTTVFQHFVVRYNGTTVSLWVNGTEVDTASLTGVTDSSNQNLTIGNNVPGGSRWFDGIMDEFGIWGRALTDAEIAQLYNNGAGITYGVVAGGDYNTVLISPEDSTISTATAFNFTANVTATGIWNNTNATIFVWDSGDTVINSTTNVLDGNETNVTTWQISGFSDGAYKWDVYSWFFNGTDYVANWSTNGNFTFEVDTTQPQVYFNTTISDQFVESFPVSVTLSAVSSDTHLDSCWYYTSDDATNMSYTCNSTTPVSFSTGGVKTIYAVANDTLGFEFQNSTSFEIATYTVTESEDPIAEGALATFGLVINKTNISSTTAFLKYNSTNYAPTTQTNTANSSTFGVSFVIPAGFGNSTGFLQYYNWSFNVTGVANLTTSTYNQTVIAPSLSDCSAGGYQILNFTHYDEATKDIVNFSNGNNLQVDLSLTSRADNSVSFVYNGTETNSPDIVVCVANGVLNSTSYKLDLTGSYVGTDYVQEFYYIDNGTVSNTNSPQTYGWYDLLLDDSTTFLFTFLDENGLQIPGVIVETIRYYIGEGQFLEVERSKEDNNGETHIHLVEEDVIYKFRITLQNQEIFLSDQYNAKCLSSPCSITLSAEPDNAPFPDVYNNLPIGSYSVQANKNTREVTLSFNLNQTATMNLSVWTQNNNEAELVAQGTTTASSGSVTVSVPLQYGNATYSAVIYKGNDFVATRVVDLSESATNYFGALGLFLGALAVLCIALIGASHGEWVVVWTVLGLLTVGLLFLVELEWYAFLTFVAGALVFLIKLIARRRVN